MLGSLRLPPVMDGLTAIRELRAAETTGVLSRHMVIALTGNARQGQIDQALAAGMDDGACSPHSHVAWQTDVYWDLQSSSSRMF